MKTFLIFAMVVLTVSAISKRDTEEASKENVATAGGAGENVAAAANTINSEETNVASGRASATRGAVAAIAASRGYRRREGNRAISKRDTEEASNENVATAGGAGENVAAAADTVSSENTNYASGRASATRGAVGATAASRGYRRREGNRGERKFDVEDK